MAKPPARKKSTGKRKGREKIQAGDVVLDVSDLKKVFGKRLEIGCLRSEIIPGDKRASLMIPANEPCPVNPHNHDGITSARLFQKVLVIKF